MRASMHGLDVDNTNFKWE